MSTNSIHNSRFKVVATGMVLLALLVVPAPLLPPHFLAEAMQSMLGVNWKTAYLMAAVGLQIVFYSSLGMLSASTVKPVTTLRGRLFQVLVVPAVVIGIAVVSRSVKTGHPPVWINAVVPTTACLFGVWFGLGLLYQRGKAATFVVVAVIGATLWAMMGGGVTSRLNRTTEDHLRRLIAAGPGLPSGGAQRFGALLQAAFAPTPGDSVRESAVQQNRAAILALGIAMGDERLARFMGLDRSRQLVQAGAMLRQGTTLREREDWSRHFCLSAALAVLEHPLVSDAGGLMKEQLDALTGGSGFSFGDLAADRAGVRFAASATESETAARAMQIRLQKGFVEGDFLPPAADLPENLTVEQFRRDYGGVGSQRYRKKVSEIESRLDRCVALSPPRSR